MFKRILFPTDASEPSLAATDAAVKFAAEQGAVLVVLNVQPPFRTPPGALVPQANYYSEEKYLEAVRGYANEVMAAVAEKAKAHSVTTEAVVKISDQVYEAIIKEAEKRQCDLIFMASHGRRGIAGMVLGSETNKVLTHCKVPALIYR
jgi:nucleotide-binding universal stress UspA family protein